MLPPLRATKTKEGEDELLEPTPPTITVGQKRRHRLLGQEN